MTDETLTDETPDIPVTDLDAWLSGASLAQVSVDILQRPDLLARYEEWTRRYERAAQAAKGNPDESLDEESPLAEITAEGEALLDEIAASRATWYLRGLSPEDVEAINAAFPEPEKPNIWDKPLPLGTDGMTEAQARAYNHRFEAWRIGKDRFNAEHKAEHDAWEKKARAMLTERGAEMIVRALDRIEVRGQVIATSITHEQALRLPKQIGEKQTSKIVGAITEAGRLEPEVPAGFLSRTSDSDQE